MAAPERLRTPRLLLRRWHPEDAAALHLVLEANADRLLPWIPTRVATPAPVEQLTQRLSEFVSQFDAGREWRYAIFDDMATRLLGEVDLFPRNASGRVAIDEADHLEIGYWLRADATGQGFATEAARAALELALALPGIARVTIRCDERNASSAAVPRRLGFQLASVVGPESFSATHDPSRLQIWEYRVEAPSAV